MIDINTRRLREEASGRFAMSPVARSPVLNDQYNALISNYILMHRGFIQRESAMHIQSLDAWMRKREEGAAPANPLEVGQIWHTSI